MIRSCVRAAEGRSLVGPARRHRDFDARGSEVRRRNDDWLTKWEPSASPARPTRSRTATRSRSAAAPASASASSAPATASASSSTATFAGEINLSSVQRGPFQSAYVGYWIDEKHAGNGYMPEAVVRGAAVRASRSCTCTACRSRSSPATAASRRVVEKLDIRDEGVAAALPRDQRRVGGPRPLRHHRRGVGGAPRRAPRRVDVERRSALRRDLGLQRGEALAEPRLLRRPHLRLELATRPPRRVSRSSPSRRASPSP